MNTFTLQLGKSATKNVKDFTIKHNLKSTKVSLLVYELLTDNEPVREYKGMRQLAANTFMLQIVDADTIRLHFVEEDGISYQWRIGLRFELSSESRRFPDYDDYKAMTIEDAAVDLGNKLYQEAVLCFVAQEHAHNLYGNGHHMAQEVVQFARELLLKRKVVNHAD